MSCAQRIRATALGGSTAIDDFRYTRRSLLGVETMVFWLAQPTRASDLPIRDELQQILNGRTSSLVFAAACVVAMAGAYAALQDGLTGLVLVVAACGSTLLRVVASRTPATAPRTATHVQAAAAPPLLPRNVRNVIASGLLWTAFIGLTGALCVASGQLMLVILACCVVTALAYGAIFHNAVAPRFARVEVAFMLLPLLITAGCSSAPHMRWILLQAPLWLCSTFFLLDKSYNSTCDLLHARQRANFLALNDQLTGLPNRAGIMTILHRCCSKPQSAGESATYVLFLDLDGFKRVNDSLGHAAGDELLCAVATRLAAAVHPPDALGRFGGDEFVVILHSATIHQVREVADRMIHCVGQPFNLAGAPDVRIGLSIGGTALASHSVSSVLARADALLYTAKRAGKGTVCLGGTASTEREVSLSRPEPCTA